MTYKLLIVDDEPPNLRLLQRLFASDYECFMASSGPAAIKVLEQHDIAIIISDQRMPGMSGIELLKATAQLRPHMVRILLTGYTDVEALVEAINCGLVYMYFTKPWNNNDLKLKVSRARDHYENNRNRSSLLLTNERLNQKLQAFSLLAVKSLVEMMRSRDEDDYNHALRVCKYAGAIARKLELGPNEINELSAAALLHNLDRSKGSITTHRVAIESVAPQTHAECELRLLESIPELANVLDVIRMLRENFDGTGYPMGLGQEQIPLGSRIIRIANEYDLLCRPKASAPLLHDEAMKLLSQRSEFDPNVLEIMAELSPADGDEAASSLEAKAMLAGLSGIPGSPIQAARN